MYPIHYLNRQSGKVEKESVYFEDSIRFLYGHSFVSRTIGRFFLHTLAKWPFCSWLFGLLQNRPASKKKVQPFIERYHIDTSEFVDNASDFNCFNDFFTRKLRPECRPLSSAKAVMPADARYRFYPKISEQDPFTVKGQKFCLETLLQSSSESSRFVGGSMVIARLCPTDCHRFYFPCDCTPGQSRLINGKLFSVNPIAIQENPWIYYKNKRIVTYLDTKSFGTVAFLEIGATSCGSITQTFTPNTFYKKGEEKGYFSFGGSALILLFEPHRIQFDHDLLQPLHPDLEIRCLIGQSLGTVV